MKTLTEEERQGLEFIKSSSKQRCGELYPTIKKLEFLLHSFREKHAMYKEKYEKADRELANATKVKNLSMYKTKKKTIKPNLLAALLVRGDIDQLIKKLQEEVGKK